MVRAFIESCPPASNKVLNGVLITVPPIDVKPSSHHFNEIAVFFIPVNWYFKVDCNVNELSQDCIKLPFRPVTATFWWSKGTTECKRPSFTRSSQNLIMSTSGSLVSFIGGQNSLWNLWQIEWPNTCTGYLRWDSIYRALLGPPTVPIGRSTSVDTWLCQSRLGQRQHKQRRLEVVWTRLTGRDMPYITTKGRSRNSIMCKAFVVSRKLLYCSFIWWG